MRVLTLLINIYIFALAFHCIQIAGHFQVNLVSDIHYDPLYGQQNAFSHCKTNRNNPLGEAGCDSPKKLIKSLVNDLSYQNSSFTLYGGDWQRHKFNENVSAEVLFLDLNHSLSSIRTLNLRPFESFIGTWGNNDVVPDYFFNVSEKEHPHLKQRIGILNRSLYSVEEANSMVECAFFSRRRQDVIFINLHSLIWSHTLKPALAEVVEDPCGQFTFLERELEFAKTKTLRVIIIAHIPPMLNLFTVIKNSKFTKASKDMLWKEFYYRRYVNLLSKYKDVVSAQFFGHLHMFYFLSFNEFASPAFVLPSISPIFENTPSYLLGLFSDNWELTNLKQRSLINKSWHATIDIDKDLGLGYNLNGKISTQSLIKRLFKNESLWSTYLQLHNGGTPRKEVFGSMKTTPFSRAVVVCSMLSGIYEEIKVCVDELVGTRDSTNEFDSPLIILSIIISLLFWLLVITMVISSVFIPTNCRVQVSTRAPII